MKRVLLNATLAALLGACEMSTDPIDGIGGGGPGGDAITQAQASGDWSLTLRRTTTLACTGGSLPDDQVIFVHLDVLNTGAVTATSTWRLSPTGTTRAIGGLVRLSDGFSFLGLLASGTAAQGMELVGTLTASGTFTGTLTDPGDGQTPVFSRCEYSVTGVKTS